MKYYVRGECHDLNGEKVMKWTTPSGDDWLDTPRETMSLDDALELLDSISLGGYRDEIVAEKQGRML